MYYKPLSHKLCLSPATIKGCGSLCLPTLILKSKLKPSYLSLKAHHGNTWSCISYLLLPNRPSQNLVAWGKNRFVCLVWPVRSWVVLLISPRTGHPASVIQWLDWGWRSSSPTPGWCQLLAGLLLTISPPQGGDPRLLHMSGFQAGQSGSRKASWGPDVRVKQQCVPWLKAGHGAATYHEDSRPPRWRRGGNTAQGCVGGEQRALGPSLQRISPVSGLSCLSSRQIRIVDASRVEPGFSLLMNLPLIPTAAGLSLSNVPSLPRPTRNVTTAQMLLPYAFNIALVLMRLEL